MNTNEIAKKLDNPEKTAGFFSKWLYFWIFKVLKKSQRKGLVEADMYECMEEFSTKKVFAKIKEFWENEKNRCQPNLWRIIMKMIGVRFCFWMFVITTIETLARIALPQFLGHLLTYFSPASNISMDNACFSALGIVACSMIILICLELLMRVSLDHLIVVRVGLSALIYDKILNIKKVEKSDLTGKVLNLLTNDMAKIEKGISYLNIGWKALTQPIPYIYFLYQELGWAAFVGISLIFALLPLQCKCFFQLD